jgi:two-component system, sensor histidine kinase
MKFTFNKIKKTFERFIHKQKASQPTSQPASQEAAKSKTSTNKNVLVVDDSSVNRYVLLRMLQIIDSTLLIDEAQNGVDAIEKCRNKSYGIVFMDVKMPRMNGDDAAKCIREFDKDTFICIVTGQIEGVEMYMKQGVNKCFSKPISLAVLREFVTDFYKKT